MPWYFYDKGGSLVTPIAGGTLAAGSIVMSVLPYTSAEPDGYLFCDGQSILRSSYLDLFTEIGTIFGAVDISHFNVPNMQSTMPRGITAFAAGMGSGGGSKTHDHAIGNHQHLMASNHSHTMPAHSHSFPSHDHPNSNHQHSNGTLVVQATAQTYPNTDYIEVPPFPAGAVHTVYEESPGAGPHRHGTDVGGLTGNPSNINTGTATGSAASKTVNLTANNLSALSGTGGAATSTAVTQLPPYFTNSFLIKT